MPGGGECSTSKTRVYADFSIQMFFDKQYTNMNITGIERSQKILRKSKVLKMQRFWTSQRPLIVPIQQYDTTLNLYNLVVSNLIKET